MAFYLCLSLFIFLLAYGVIAASSERTSIPLLTIKTTSEVNSLRGLDLAFRFVPIMSPGEVFGKQMMKYLAYFFAAATIWGTTEPPVQPALGSSLVRNRIQMLDQQMDLATQYIQVLLGDKEYQKGLYDISRKKLGKSGDSYPGLLRTKTASEERQRELELVIPILQRWIEQDRDSLKKLKNCSDKYALYWNELAKQGFLNPPVLNKLNRPSTSLLRQVERMNSEQKDSAGQTSEEKASLLGE